MSFLLVTCIAIGDCAIAEGYRKIVRSEIIPELERHSGKFYFSGHWGFQYYAQLAGGQVIDRQQQPHYKEGDLIAIPAVAWTDIDEPGLAESQHATTRKISHTPDWPVRTVDPGGFANFHGSLTLGADIPTLLPFGFSSGPSETLKLYHVQE